MEQEKHTLDLLDISPCVRYVHACYNATAATHQVPKRYIYDYQFLFIASGELSVATGDKTFCLKENMIHIIPPMQFHTMYIPHGVSCTYYSVHFDFIGLGRENDFSPEDIYIANCNRSLDTAPVNERLLHRPLYSLGGVTLPETMSVNNPIAYTELLVSMIRLQREKPFAWEIDMKCSMLSVLKLILYDIRHTHNIPGQRMEHFSYFAAYLADHFNENINFQELARMFGYSYSSFRKQFKECSGKSPHGHLTDLRLSRAVVLLQSGRYTVTEVARMVGYVDNAYFSRIFRRKKGCSPSSFLSS